MENFPPIQTDKRTAFGAPLIGQRDERLSLTVSAPKALRLSNSIEPTPSGLRSARSVGTENCISMQFPPPTDGGSSRCPLGPNKNEKENENEKDCFSFIVVVTYWLWCS